MSSALRMAGVADMVRVLGALITLGATAQVCVAHDIPTNVRVQMHVRAEGEALTVLVRAPLQAMRDFAFATRGPGYLDLANVDAQLENAVRLWLVNDLTVYEEDRPLPSPRISAVRVALPSDPAFDSFETARVAVSGERLPIETDLYWQQAVVDAALVYAIESDRSRFALEPGFARLALRTVTEIRYLGADGSARGLSFVGDPGRIELDPSPLPVFVRFVASGFEHVLDGLDHLLFLLALILPLMAIRPLVVVVTAFTLAHSITLGAMMLDLVPSGLWFPPLVELAIAATILYMALENLVRASVSQRWLTGFGFGLVHGFGFSFALKDTLQFAGDHILVSLAGFNLGIELGQLLVLVLVVPTLRLTTRWFPAKGLAVVLSVLVAHSAWHWVAERWTVFSAYSIPPPTLDMSLLVGAMRWLMLLLVAVFVIWLVRTPLERWAGIRRSDEDSVG